MNKILSEDLEIVREEEELSRLKIDELEE